MVLSWCLPSLLPPCDLVLSCSVDGNVAMVQCSGVCFVGWHVSLDIPQLQLFFFSKAVACASLTAALNATAQFLLRLVFFKVAA